MAAKTWIGRFCVADGRADEDGPWLASLIRQRPDEAPDELYAVVEAASAGSVEHTAQLVEVIARLYRKDALSLTGALTRSLRAAHEHLADWNEKSLPEHRIGAGASCLALSGSDAYLAQIGPSLAYVRRAGGELRRIEPHDRTFAASLGMAEAFEPRLVRVRLEPGDLLVVATTSLDEVAGAAQVERILSRPTDDVLPEFYLMCREVPNFALVLVSCFEEPLDTPPEFLTTSAKEEAGAPAREDAVGFRMAQDVAGEDLAYATVGLESGAVAQAVLDDWVAPSRPVKEQVDEIKEAAAPLRAPGVALRGGGSNIRYKKTTGPAIPVQFRVPPVAILAVAGVVLVGLLAWWLMPGSVQENREERYASYVAAAREANARAQATGDPGLRRTLLADARSSLEDAANIHDDTPEVLSLQSDITAALNVLNAVHTANDVRRVVDLAETVTGDLGATQIALGGDAVYVLDAEGGRVLRVPAGGGAPETVFERGKAVNLETASRPTQIAWSTQAQALFVVDDQRQTFVYFPGGGVLSLAVRDAEGLGSIDAIAAASDNLYVLDREQNQVWRYYPGQGGFDSERTALLDGADLENATELAVARDVYVLDSEAGVRRFILKTEGAFPLAGIDTAPIAPASLLVLPGSNRIVFVDTGNKRVVVASDDGRFLRQIVSPEFTDLRAVAIDEGAGKMFLLNGDAILEAAFPP